MSLAQFLSQLGGAIGGQQMGNQAMQQMPSAMQMPGIIGGFGGGTFDLDGRQVTPVQRGMAGGLLDLTGLGGVPAINPADVVQTPANMMEQIRSAPQLRDPFAGAPAQSQASPDTKKFTGLRDTLGQIGDYLLQANDMQPIYAPRKQKFEQDQASEAVAAYLGNINPALADVARKSPQTGLQLFNALREDTRFNRSAGQDDRRLDQGDRAQGEVERRNRVDERLTERGQTLSAQTQMQLANLRQQEAAASRAFDAAMAQNDHARAKELLGLQQQFQLQIKSLEGGGTGYDTITETVETEAKPAQSTWYGKEVAPATPAKKTVTERKVPRQGAQSGPSQADLEFTARKHGITVEEVKQRLGLK